MKRLVLISAIMLSFTILIYAQGVSKTWITLGDSSEIEGLLYQTNDSSVQITNSFLKKDLLSGKYQLKVIYYNKISIIETGNIFRVSKGALIGAVGGTVIGAVIGFSSGYHPGSSLSYSTAYSLQFGTLGLLVGTLIGAVIGSNTIKISINGNIDKFNKHKSRLRKYSYIH